MPLLKKVIFTFLALVSCVACGDSKNQLSRGKLRVLSTTSQVGDLVRMVGGDRIHAEVLIGGNLDPHSYEMVKGDGEKLLRADHIFYNGLGLEHGASLSSFLRSSEKATPLGEKIQEAAPDKILKKNGVLDPHIWMDISLWEKGVDPIAKVLSELDPEGAPFYEERAAALHLEMHTRHDLIFASMQKIPSEKRYLVTSHDAFQYFTRSYLAEPGELDWEKRFAAPEGLAPEGQLGAHDIQKIIDYLKEKRVSVLFPESNVNRDALRKIASAGKELGLVVQIAQDPLYGDAMGGLAYLEMMDKNATTIAKYLWNMQ